MMTFVHVLSITNACAGMVDRPVFQKQLCLRQLLLGDWSVDHDEADLLPPAVWLDVHVMTALEDRSVE